MNSPYLLLPIGILTLLLYFISTLLLKQGVVSKLWHRRFWNILLLLTFMTVCILGLLLAIQINYKLNWPIVKALLKWHVDFGIAMSIIAFIHLWWHLNYYLELFKKKPVSAKVIDEIKDSRPESNEPTSTPLILLSGFISTIIQVLLIREITTVFQGNELMIGWMLGAWMLLTGIGAFLGRTIHTLGNIRSVLLKAIFVISIIPVFIVVSINLLKNQLFPPGIMVNPAYFLVALFLMLLPICLLAGIVYSLLVKVNRNRTDTAVWVYSMESFGSLAGGIVVSFVMVIWLSVLQSLLIVAIISLTLLFVLSRKRIYAFWGFSYIIILLLVLIFPVDLWIKSKLYTSQEIIKSDETYYGNLTVTKNAGQYNFFQSGSLLSSTGNIIANEEDVHYAMLQRTEAKNVLILSAGAIGTITEVLKYNAIKSFDFVELNPQLLDIFLSYSPPPNDERLHIYSGDGKLFIRKTKKKYDLVIFALPDPASIQINRYYTDEFIKNCKKKLSPNAVVCYSSSPAGNYISPGKIKTEATLYNTLKANFNQVRIVPGEKDYFLASDSAIDIHISKLSNSRGVEAEYVNKFYIDDFSIE